MLSDRFKERIKSPSTTDIYFNKLRRCIAKQGCFNCIGYQTGVCDIPEMAEAEMYGAEQAISGFIKDACETRPPYDVAQGNFVFVQPQYSGPVDPQQRYSTQIVVSPLNGAPQYQQYPQYIQLQGAPQYPQIEERK